MRPARGGEKEIGFRTETFRLSSERHVHEEAVLATVLVTDGEQRAALATVRSLGRAGHRVLVCGDRRRTIAGSSRFADQSVQAPPPLRDPAGFLDAVRTIARDENVDVLLPISEAALIVLLPARAALQPATIPFADFSSFTRISDKGHLMEVARALGISVPSQVTLGSAEELSEAKIRFPVVVKPARSVVQTADGGQKTTVIHAADAASLRHALASIPAAAYPVLVQQRVVGPGAGVFVLLWDGRVVAAMGHRRLREKPPSGGVSVYRESTPVDPELMKLSVRLLERFDWRGPAMVEYKLDGETGEAFLMEVNGRFWGSLQLAIDAGVDFPRLLVDAALGKTMPQAQPYRAGVRSRWWWGDVDHLLTRMRHGRTALSLPDTAPGRLRVLADFIAASGPRSRNEVLQWSDPMPMVRESLDWFRRR